MGFRVIILNLWILTFISLVKAQDPVHSQFYYNRLELNPAFAGNDGVGKFRANLFHRNLYRPIKGPFNSSNFSMDYSLCNANIGLGLIASNENQGDGFLATNKVEGVLGIGPIRIGSNMIVSAGMKIGYVFQNLDWSKYTFSDQFDPILGNVRPSVNSSIVSDFSNAPVIGIGLNLSGWNWKRTFAWNAGFAGNNLFGRTQLGYLSPYILPARYTLYGAITMHRNPAINSNSGRIFTRLDLQDFTGTKFITNILLGEYYFNNTLNLGLGIRTALGSTTKAINALIISTGIQPVSTLKIIGSYEINVSGTANGNTFELGMVWVPEQEICALNSFLNMFRSKKRGGGRVNKINCPVFGKDVIRPF
jgi:type IX secretion system PorP/SprF family membrane protein